MIVLLHPFPFDSRVFDGLKRELPDLLTPDLHGTGEPDLGALADQVITSMDRAGVATAHVGGVSMGGYVALNLLRRYRDRLTGLILIDTKASADTPDARDNRFAVAERADRGIRPVADDLLKGMLSAQTRAELTDVVGRLAGIIDDQPLSEIGWNQRAMAARPDSSELLAAIDLPVLVVVGSGDTITPPETARQLANTAKLSTMVEIPATGHLAVAEDPKAVAAAIRNWVGEHD